MENIMQKPALTKTTISAVVKASGKFLSDSEAFKMRDEVVKKAFSDENIHDVLRKLSKI